MTEPISITMYADLACPYAYVSAYRLRQLREEDRAPVAIVHKSLALEYVNREPTPKPVLEQELCICCASPLRDLHAVIQFDALGILAAGRA